MWWTQHAIFFLVQFLRLSPDRNILNKVLHLSRVLHFEIITYLHLFAILRRVFLLLFSVYLKCILVIIAGLYLKYEIVNCQEEIKTSYTYMKYLLKTFVEIFLWDAFLCYFKNLLLFVSQKIDHLILRWCIRIFIGKTCSEYSHIYYLTLNISLAIRIDLENKKRKAKTKVPYFYLDLYFVRRKVCVQRLRLIYFKSNCFL